MTYSRHRTQKTERGLQPQPKRRGDEATRRKNIL
jgi:hypothetical protein